MFSRDGRSIDGLVRLYDIAEMSLRSFAILSACETAEGKEVNGEGLISLSRGFLSSGASGVLASPFRVDDEASSLLISNFLKNILGSKPMPPPLALRQARQVLAHSQRWHDPFYWGTFMLVAGWR
jgi:CHAT domain-containing protein